MRVSLSHWRSVPVAVQRRLIRWIAEHHDVPDVGFEAVERALAVGLEGGPPRAELGGGLTVKRQAHTLVFDSTERHRDA